MSTSDSSTKEIEVSDLRAGLRDTLDDVFENGRRLVVSRHGRRIAAVVPLGDLRTLEARDAATAAALQAEARDERDEYAPNELSVDEAIEQFRHETSTRSSTVTPRRSSNAPESDAQVHGHILREIVAATDSIDVRDSERSLRSLRDAIRSLAGMVSETESRQRTLVSAMKASALVQLGEAQVLDEDLERAQALVSSSMGART